jgi:hypothetical protein
MDLQTPRSLAASSLSRTTRRTALRGLTAGGLAAGLLGAGGLRGNTPATRAAQDGTPGAAPSWRLTGTGMEACRCAVTCPCNFGSDPTEIPCGVVIGWHFTDGQYGDTPLGDLNLIAYAQMPGNIWEGGWTMGVYLDERADPDQAEALGAIFSGQAGGWPVVLSALIAKPLPPKQVPIEMTFEDDNVQVVVPGLLEVATERVPNPLPGGPPLDLKVSNLAVPFYTENNATADVRRSTTLKLTDPNMSFEYSGRSSLIGAFEYRGP